ncbi:MAG: hypothetical protein JST00_20485 [Deltaproteobacteria bacterium]|nr:hypothetical protein [Deltaproteobacteria bacterium]
MSLVRSALGIAATSALLVACPRASLDPHLGAGTCAGLEPGECGRAKGLLAAASAFGNVKHEYLLDPASSISPGRGVQHDAEGAYSILPTKCAQERTHPGAPTSAADSRVDRTTIDFTYVGIAVDQHLVSADADLSPWLSAGVEGAEKKVSLVALAFVRDLDPQFFAASDDVSYAASATPEAAGGCTCGRATHFVGSVKLGGLLSYEMRVRSGEVHGRALEFFKARLAAGDSRITQTVVGGLEVEGLDAAMAQAPKEGGAPKPLSFKVKNPVPIAYALYPLSDVCRFAFPSPEVSPEVIELGDVPYGREETRLLHVVNRAAIDLRATLGERTFAVPALGSADVPFAWTPNGASLGCEIQTREEILQFTPRDGDVPVTPKTQSVKVTARVRTGKATFRRHEHIDTGVHRKPEYAATKREWTCPPDYALASCKTEQAQCGDGRCTTDGYAVNAEPIENGCRFGCTGPEGLLPGISSMFCRFDAVMECRLRCR